MTRAIHSRETSGNNTDYAQWPCENAVRRDSAPKSRLRGSRAPSLLYQPSHRRIMHSKRHRDFALGIGARRVRQSRAFRTGEASEKVFVRRSRAAMLQSGNFLERLDWVFDTDLQIANDDLGAKINFMLETSSRCWAGLFPRGLPSRKVRSTSCSSTSTLKLRASWSAASSELPGIDLCGAGLSYSRTSFA